MNQIISLKAEGETTESLIQTCETTAKSVADNMPQEHKDALAHQFLAHYFILILARNANPDVNTPHSEAAFETLSNILATSGIEISSISTTKTNQN